MKDFRPGSTLSFAIRCFPLSEFRTGIRNSARVSFAPAPSAFRSRATSVLQFRDKDRARALSAEIAGRSKSIAATLVLRIVRDRSRGKARTVLCHSGRRCRRDREGCPEDCEAGSTCAVLRVPDVIPAIVNARISTQTGIFRLDRSFGLDSDLVNYDLHIMHARTGSYICIMYTVSARRVACEHSSRV